MSAQAFANPQTPYWAPASLVDNVDQLDLSVAFSSLTAPLENQVVTWDDPGAGVYPLTDNRGATKTTPVTILPSGDIGNVNSMDLTPVAANPGDAETLWINSADGHLYRGAVDLEAAGGGGDVVGPLGSTLNAVARYSDASGKLIKDCDIVMVDTGTANLFCVRDPGTLPSGNGNTLMGKSVMNKGSINQSTNACFGSNILSLGPIAAGSPVSFNTIMGGNACQDTTVSGGSFSFNTIYGQSAGQALSSTGAGGGSIYNTLLGTNAGSAYTDDCQYNICIHNVGVDGDSNTIRIGNATDHNRCFAAGVLGVTPAGALEGVVVNSSGQLGSRSLGTPLGMLTNENGIATTVISAASSDFTSAVTVTSWGSAIAEEGVIPDLGAGTITIPADGIYRLSLNFSLVVATTSTVSAAFYRGATKLPVRVTQRCTLNDPTNMSLEYISLVPAGTAVSIKIQNETSATNITIADACFTATRLTAL